MRFAEISEGTSSVLSVELLLQLLMAIAKNAAIKILFIIIKLLKKLAISKKLYLLSVVLVQCN